MLLRRCALGGINDKAEVKAVQDYVIVDVGVVDELPGGVGELRDDCEKFRVVEWLAAGEAELVGCEKEVAGVVRDVRSGGGERRKGMKLDEGLFKDDGVLEKGQVALEFLRQFLNLSGFG